MAESRSGLRAGRRWGPAFAAPGFLPETGEASRPKKLFQCAASAEMSFECEDVCGMPKQRRYACQVKQGGNSKPNAPICGLHSTTSTLPVMLPSAIISSWKPHKTGISRAWQSMMFSMRGSPSVLLLIANQEAHACRASRTFWQGVHGSLQHGQQGGHRPCSSDGAGRSPVGRQLPQHPAQAGAVQQGGPVEGPEGCLQAAPICRGRPPQVGWVTCAASAGCPSVLRLAGGNCCRCGWVWKRREAAASGMHTAVPCLIKPGVSAMPHGCTDRSIRPLVMQSPNSSGWPILCTCNHMIITCDVRGC
jgi:hypothetical protein